MDEDRAFTERRIAEALGSATQLGALFAELEQTLGRGTASRIWWASFGEWDAAET